MILEKTEHDLGALVEYLVTEKGHDATLRELRIVHSPKLDRRNKEDPRAFCEVEEGNPEILCSRSIEVIGAAHRVGILLHEIAHHGIDGFKSVKSEVDVDVAILKQLPSAGYDYDDHQLYVSPTRGKIVMARDVQCVCLAFLNEIGASDV